MSELTITKVLLLKNNSLNAESISRMLARKSEKPCVSTKCGGISEIESEWGTQNLTHSRPGWVCLIDDIALATPASEGATTFEDVLLPLVEEEGSLIDLYNARAVIREGSLIFRNENCGPIQQDFSFSPIDLTYDQMVQLATLETAPVRSLTLECVGAMGDFSLYGYLKYFNGAEIELLLCNNFGKYVSEPIRESEISQVRFLSHWQLNYPVFIEVL